MSSARTQTLEAARRVAHLWDTVGDPGREALLRDISPAMARALDTLLGIIKQPEHHITTFPSVELAGLEPTTPVEWYWACSCREGHSGDLGSSAKAVSAAGHHAYSDPTKFPGWLE